MAKFILLTGLKEALKNVFLEFPTPYLHAEILSCSNFDTKWNLQMMLVIFTSCSFTVSKFYQQVISVLFQYLYYNTWCFLSYGIWLVRWSIFINPWLFYTYVPKYGRNVLFLTLTYEGHNTNYLSILFVSTRPNEMPKY